MQYFFQIIKSSHRDHSRPVWSQCSIRQPIDSADWRSTRCLEWLRCRHGITLQYYLAEWIHSCRLSCGFLQLHSSSNRCPKWFYLNPWDFNGYDRVHENGSKLSLKMRNDEIHFPHYLFVPNYNRLSSVIIAFIDSSFRTVTGVHVESIVHLSARWILEVSKWMKYRICPDTRQMRCVYFFELHKQ